ncbi:MAG: hypothetical protein UX17_C0037G0003 [Parcubacteria group bacterium GW2011_GWC2_45_7]|nr:MAG: hypothetical protein UX17_C0037G0003 [Parcubacteria group bacterium GW2011_GWC2_45_7]HIH18358.1 hypothetical protein [Candidatus Micrarchaeota archaeon]HIH31043.1 hypothetical protein [Candidatus Micrarchaeota archaeon]
MSSPEGKLTDATKRGIEQGRREIAEGRGITTAELLKKLGLNVKHRKHAYK